MRNFGIGPHSLEGLAVADAPVTAVSAIPGLRELWSETLGDPAICVAVLDGPVDLSHPCFAGAQIMQLELQPGIRNSRVRMADHGTHVASIIFGQHHSSVLGIAPRCRGLVIPIFEYEEDGSLRACSQSLLAEAIVAASNLGAHVINISAGQFSPEGAADRTLAAAVERCLGSSLIVAATGNDGCRCLHVPGALPSVLAVGAMAAEGEPLSFSNWGDAYLNQGVLALGENIVGATAGGGTAACSGTSFATPIVSGVAALLLSLQRKLGQQPRPDRLRDAILLNTVGCAEQPTAECDRLLAGRLNVRGSVGFLKQQGTATMNSSFETQSNVSNCDVTHAPSNPPAPRPSGVVQSACGCGGNGQPPQYVYVIGRLSYDFESQTREDSIQQAMDSTRGVRRELRVSNEIDLLRHIRGFDEVQVDAAIGGINRISRHAGTDFIQIQTRPRDPEIGNADNFREIAIAGLAESYDGGATYQSSALNTSAHARLKIRRLGPHRFYIVGYPFNNIVQYRTQDANWYLPRKSTVTTRHRPHPHDAKAVVWLVRRGASALYAVRPQGSYSEDAYEELSAFLLRHHGLSEKGLNLYYFVQNGETVEWFAPWDPSFNQLPIGDRQGSYADPTTAERSESVAIPGSVTSQVTLKTGESVRTIVPEIRGTAEWSRERLMKRIEDEVFPILSPTDEERPVFDGKVRDLLDRLDEEVRNSGTTAKDRALNFASTQHVSVISQVARDLLGPFQLESVAPPRMSEHCRQGSDCWDIEISFFNPDNIQAAPIIVRQSIDVSDVVPIQIEGIRRFRRR